MIRLASVHMTTAKFMRDKALKEGLPEFAVIADQLDDLEEIKPLLFEYIKGYTRLRVAMKIIAGDDGDDRIDTLDKAQFLAKEALRYAEEK